MRALALALMVATLAPCASAQQFQLPPITHAPSPATTTSTAPPPAPYRPQQLPMRTPPTILVRPGSTQVTTPPVSLVGGATRPLAPPPGPLVIRTPDISLVGALPPRAHVDVTTALISLTGGGSSSGGHVTTAEITLVGGVTHAPVTGPGHSNVTTPPISLIGR